MAYEFPLIKDNENYCSTLDALDIASADGSIIIETARVVAVAADVEASVWIETMQGSACGSCVSKKICGNEWLHSLYKGRGSWLKLPSRHLNDLLQVNDIVELIIPGRIVVWGSFLVYLVPVCMMILGAIVGQLSTGQLIADQAGAEVAAMLGGVAGFSLGFLVVRWHGYHHRNNPALQPRLLRRVGVQQ